MSEGYVPKGMLGEVLEKNAQVRGNVWIRHRLITFVLAALIVFCYLCYTHNADTKTTPKAGLYCSNRNITRS